MEIQICRKEEKKKPLVIMQSLQVSRDRDSGQTSIQMVILQKR